MGKRARGTLVKIVFIGAGNVATHLAPAMESGGVGHVCQVYSRTEDSAVKLCERLAGALPVTAASDIIPDADVYVVSLADHAVKDVLDRIKSEMPAEMTGNNALWLHTSGSLPVDVLSSMSDFIGVLYPLQTFSRNVGVDMREVPIFIEGNTPDVTARVRDVAGKISPKVYYADGELRRRMHVAAVFACNFTNHMFTVADDLLRMDGLTLEVLYPLIKETVRKAMAGVSPAAGQTGPAVRGDRSVVERHASMLPPDLSAMYMQLSESIYIRNHGHKEDR